MWTELTSSLTNMCVCKVSDPTNGVPRYGLSVNGQLEAQEAGKSLAAAFGRDDSGVIEIVTSDFKRAHETASAVSTAFKSLSHPRNIQITVDSRLRERNFGEFELQSNDNYQRVWDVDKVDARHTSFGVESVESVGARASAGEHHAY